MKKVFLLLLALLILIGSIGYLIHGTGTPDSSETTASSMANVPEQESSSAPAEDFESEDTSSTTDTAEQESTGNEESETSMQNKTESPQKKDHVTDSPRLCRKKNRPNRRSRQKRHSSQSRLNRL